MLIIFYGLTNVYDIKFVIANIKGYFLYVKCFDF